MDIMGIEKLDINAMCFGILCNFTPVCGEEKAKEAVALVRSLQTENEKLRAELEQVKNERDSARATLSWLALYGLKKEDCHGTDD